MGAVFGDPRKTASERVRGEGRFVGLQLCLGAFSLQLELLTDC